MLKYKTLELFILQHRIFPTLVPMRVIAMFTNPDENVPEKLTEQLRQEGDNIMNWSMTYHNAIYLESVLLDTNIGGIPGIMLNGVIEKSDVAIKDEAPIPEFPNLRMMPPDVNKVNEEIPINTFVYDLMLVRDKFTETKVEKQTLDRIIKRLNK